MSSIRVVPALPQPMFDDEPLPSIFNRLAALYGYPLGWILEMTGLADDEGTAPSRWKDLKSKLGDLLFQWPKGCTEQHVIGAIPEVKLQELLKDGDGELDGDRLRTLAVRLGLQDKRPAAIAEALTVAGKTWRELLIDASTGSKVGAPESEEKSWKSHSRYWFKSEAGGRELAEKMAALGAWDGLQPQLLPLINAIMVAVERPSVTNLKL